MTDEEAIAAADEYRRLIRKRTGFKPADLVCPREKGVMTPCVARDGGLAVSGGGAHVCVGCDEYLSPLLATERARHA